MAGREVKHQERLLATEKYLAENAGKVTIIPVPCPCDKWPFAHFHEKRLT